MPRLLMVVSSARTLKLADGTDHPTGYWAEEVEKPHRRFIEQGVEVVVATPDGQPPQPDPYGLEAIQQPRKLSDITDEEALTFDGVFFPGGHGPMVDLHENPDVDRIVRLLHERECMVAALCHGPAALLSVGEGHEGWLFDGYKMTAFTDEEEDQTQAGRLGMAWYLETALKNQGAVFDDGDSAWAPHIVVDRNLVTAQIPASSEAAADAVLKKLGVR